MSENMDKKQLGEQLEEVAGGKTIKSEDGKFYVIPDNSMPFSTEEDAKNAEKMLHSRPFPPRPHHLPMVIPQNNALTTIPGGNCEKGSMKPPKLDEKPQNPIAAPNMTPEIK